MSTEVLSTCNFNLSSEELLCWSIFKQCLQHGRASQLQNIIPKFVRKLCSSIIYFLLLIADCFAMLQSARQLWKEGGQHTVWMQ